MKYHAKYILAFIGILYLTACSSTQSAKISFLELELLVDSGKSNTHEKMNYEVTTNSNNPITNLKGIR